MTLLSGDCAELNQELLPSWNILVYFSILFKQYYIYIYVSPGQTILSSGFQVLLIIRDGPLEKLWGGGAGEVQKKKFMQGKIKWKKIHACRVDQEKKFLHWPSTHFAQILRRQAGKHTVCKTSALWINFLLNFGLVNNHTWYKKIYLRLVSLS